MGSNGTSPEFDDRDWTSGVGRVGFERDSGYEDVLGIDVGSQVYRINTSIYVRVPFSATDPSKFDTVQLRMKYDDGFVAYLNGADVARRLTTEELKWSSRAIAQVLSAGLYDSDKRATFEGGDWNGDGVFDRLDVIVVLRTGNYPTFRRSPM